MDSTITENEDGSIILAYGQKTMLTIQKDGVIKIKDKEVIKDIEAAYGIRQILKILETEWSSNQYQHLTFKQ